MKYHVVYIIVCVVVSLYMVFLFNLAPVSPWKPALRLTLRNNSNWSVHDINEKRQQQQRKNETTTKIGRHRETSENEQALEFINKRNKTRSSKLIRNELIRLIRRKNGNKHPQTFAPRTNLIILSPGRGGSSFLGAMFDSNPHVMYWFEPFYTVYQEMNLLNGTKEPIPYKETCINLIDSFFKCNFSNITKATLLKLSRNIFRYRSQSLTSGLLCPGKNNTRCLPFSKTLLSKACNSYNYTVIKILTSRVPNGTIQSIQGLFQQQDRYDVKIIHLVRDPRAVVYSMANSVKWIEKNYSHDDFRSYVSKMCNLIEQNVRTGLLNPPSWLRNRFKVIRFEDIAVNTINNAHELYRFAGFDWSISVDKWISAHNRPPSNEQERDAYSLYRNASDVIDKWKNAPKDFIRAIEDICGNLMDLLGYEKLIKQDRKIM
ncbi:carbohydrate sulfotransferase 6-like [Oculina patagonica]